MLHDAPQHAPAWLRELQTDGITLDSEISWPARSEELDAELSLSPIGGGIQLTERVPGRIPKSSMLNASRPFRVQLSRSKTGRAASAIERAVGRQSPAEHWLHLEVRQGQERFAARAREPFPKALEGLPWMERGGLVVERDMLLDLTRHLLTSDHATLARWDVEDAREPERRLVAEDEPWVEAAEVARSSKRPALSTWAIVRLDLQARLYMVILAGVFVAFFAVPSIALYQMESQYAGHGQSVSGVVIGWEDEGDDLRVRYRFLTTDGTPIEGNDTVPEEKSSAYTRGSTINLQYIDGAPHTNRIYRAGNSGTTMPLVVLGLLALALLFFTARPLFGAWRRAREAQELFRIGERVDAEVVEHHAVRSEQDTGNKRLWLRYRAHDLSRRVLTTSSEDATRFPVGATVPVYVDPTNPDRATWHRPLKDLYDNDAWSSEFNRRET